MNRETCIKSKIAGSLAGSLLALSLLMGQGCPATMTTSESTGSQGLDGSQGAEGPQGPQGPAGADGAQGPAGPAGAAGATGPAGADGSLRIYGDGSRGAFIANGGALSGGHYQFTDFTVNAGASLLVASGTVIRCTGTFTNNGTIIVETGTIGSSRGGANAASAIELSEMPTESGLSSRAAGFGQYGNNGAVRSGGEGGIRLASSDEAAGILSPGTKAGGAGAGTVGGMGGEGGGSFTVLARVAIVNSNTGEISADGGTTGLLDGAGGGAGGFVILASPGSVTNDGSIHCNGGNGDPNNINVGAGGGGGGGVIHVISSAIGGQGVFDVNGGAKGAISGTVSLSPRSGGGGGGALGGNGGMGGAVETNNTADMAQDGDVGITIKTIADPTSLF